MRIHNPYFLFLNNYVNKTCQIVRVVEHMLKYVGTFIHIKILNIISDHMRQIKMKILINPYLFLYSPSYNCNYTSLLHKINHVQESNKIPMLSCLLSLMQLY